MSSVYDFKATAIDGTEVPLDRFRGKALLIVNTASRCGFTNQYAGLETLHELYQDKPFEVLGFPCNRFGAQEPGKASEIADFCTTTFGVKFPMFDKISVKGPEQHPLYRWLTHNKRGFLGSRDIKWNFTKFLTDRQGQVVSRHAPDIAPESLRPDIEKLLA
jgi:Glutathione peroxidase